jgi:hypothetical protein
MSAIMSALLTYFALVVTPQDAMSQPFSAGFVPVRGCQGAEQALL